MPETCEPPPEHRGERWHIVTCPLGLRYLANWTGGKLYLHTGLADGRRMYRDGWRYVAPCPPPQEAGEP